MKFAKDENLEELELGQVCAISLSYYRREDPY
jgi:hypothetical protein